MKKTEKAIKALLIEKSAPDVESIKSKFEFNTNGNTSKIKADVIASARKRNTLLVLFACLLLIVSIGVALPYLINNSSSNANFGIIYFDGSQADWQFDTSINDIAKEHRVMRFKDLVEQEQAYDVNNPGTLRIIYGSDDSEQIIMNVYLNNKLSEEFRYCLKFNQNIMWESRTVLYNTEITSDAIKHTIFFQDQKNSNNYVIRITAKENKGINYYLNLLEYIN